MLTKLKSPAREAMKAFQELGMSAKDVLGVQKDVATGHLDRALGKIAALNAKLAPEKSNRLMSDIFGQEGERAANVLLRANTDTGDKGAAAYTAKFSDVDGAVARTSKIMETSLAGSIERAGGALQGLSTQVGEVMKPAAESLGKSVEGAADSLSKLVKKYPGATSGTLGLAGTLAALALGLKGALLAASAYHSTMGAYTATMEKLAAKNAALNLSTLSLVAAAGLAGYAIGTWADQTFGLHEKFLKMIGMGAPKVEKPSANPDQTYPDGTVITAKGELKKLGSGMREDHGSGNLLRPGSWVSGEPAVVRDARAAGATTFDEIAAFVKDRNNVPAGTPEMLKDLPRKAPTQAEIVAMADRKRRDEHDKVLGQLKNATDKDQVKVLLDILTEMKRNRPRIGSGGGTGAGESAF
jgi:hypothetical protein